uniref:Reverse transcriptase domain-containing protein n=1 Tax=Fagus sylvatica TaxID=28930 RepID=A0A2N9FDP4_FAGSY
MEDLTGKWQNLSLTDKEDQRVILDSGDDGEGSILAASFLTPRVINMDSVLRALKPLWRAGRDLKARDMGNNKAMMDASMPFSKASFTHMSFWVQIHDLPVQMMKKEVSEAIGRTLGVVEQAEDIDEGRSKGNYMRVRVTLDIQHPLCRGRKVSAGGNNDHWVSFKYERLTNFCYWCGMITHGEKDCELWLRSHGSLSTASQPYGAWMRGEPERFGRKLPNNFDPSRGTQGTQSEKDTAPTGGGPEKPTVRKETPARTFVLNKERTTPDYVISGPIHGPINESDMVRDSSTHEEQVKEFVLASKRNACKRVGHHVNGGAILEGTSKGQNIVVPTFSGPPNDMVDMVSDTLSLSKPHNKPSSSTWKRSAGRKKSALYEVPVLHIAGSKRNNEELLLGEDDLEKVGKRVKGDTGLGNPEAVRALHHMVKKKGPEVLFLMETKLDAVRMEVIRIKLGFDNAFTVPSLGRSGGLALLWKVEADVVIQNFSQHHIDAHVDSKQANCWRLTGFYGRDFNEILRVNEKYGGRERSLRQILDFQEAVNTCNLVDLGFQGAKYTWTNNRDDDANIQGRLDRALATAPWLDFFPRYSVSHFSVSVSDHLELVVSTVSGTFTSRRKKIVRRFEEKWATNPDCEKLIQESWMQPVNVGSPMVQLCQKISRCRTALIDWSREVFEVNSLQVNHKIEALEALHEDNHGGRHNHQIKRLRDEVNLLLHQDELHWRQRSREIWLAAGDKNTRYFHQKAKQRKGKNMVKGLLDSNGEWCEKETRVSAMVVQYFEDIFSASTGLEVENTVRCIPSVVMPDMNRQLLSQFTAVEVQQATFQMHPSKAPGPDGYMLRKINHSHIVLIPKKKNPQLVSDYRPISLSNVVYKILSKVLANRLKQVLPTIISESQSAFVPGRQITDNINVAFELMHCLRTRRKGKIAHMALKLDMSKAYDRVEWIFLERVMARMGFASRWIRLLMTCVQTTSYSVLLNGEPTGYIKPTRGIRQGDPLSPYLFLLCAEGLSALLCLAEREQQIHGVSICRNGPQISHLLFADDSLLFCQATEEECTRLMEVLAQYERASSQMVNKEKTALFFSKNTPEVVRRDIQQLWGVQGTANFKKYLGLPAMVGKSKKHTFNNLKERIAQRLQGWKEQLLSKAGRAILIKTIAQAIPTYTMSCFKLPKNWCADINSLISNYWWGQRREENKIHWINWGRLCSLKEDGGVGFRDIHSFNMALLAKQGWRLLSQPWSLFAKCFKAKYFPGVSFLKAKLGSNPSYIWRSILASRDLLRKGLRWQIGNGQQVHVWEDDWGPKPLHQCPNPREVQWVADLIDAESGSWDVSMLREVFDEASVQQVQQVELTDCRRSDYPVWTLDPHGLFSVKSAYTVVTCSESHGEMVGSSEKTQNQRMWRKVWKLKIPNKILAVRFVREPARPLLTLFWACPYAASVWALMPGRLQKLPSSELDFFLLSRQLVQDLTCELSALWAVTCWAIWHARNKFIHENMLLPPQQTLDMATRLLRDYQIVQSGQQMISSGVR